MFILYRSATIYSQTMKLSPKTLFEMSVEYVCSYMYSTVSSLRQKYDGECSDTLEFLLEIRKYLAKNLHPHIIDYLLNSTIPPKSATDSEMGMLLKIYLHENMARFQPKFKVASSIEKELYRLSRLVVLSLHLVCTDEILEIVGQNCPALEGIDIVSKVGTYWNSMNALKLKYYVSDDGVKHLHRCRKLKRIVMRKINGSSSSGGKKITNKGIVELLTKLPDLQFIRYNDMGFVFQDFTVDMRLNLLHVHDDHTCLEHVQKIVRLCPKLKGLCITFPRSVNDVDEASSCLKQLADSELSLSTLYMRGFSDFSFHFARLFEIKGNRLTALSLTHHRLISFDTLKTIGETCPLLRYFELYASVSHYSMSRSQIASLSDLKYFQNLERLKIIGHAWKPKIVFPLLLYNATRLKFVVLVNWDYSLSSDKEMLLLMSRNRLAFLEQFWSLGLEFQFETLFQLVTQHHRTLRTIEVRGKVNYSEFLRVLNCQGNFGFDVVQNVMHVFGNCFCFEL